MSENSIRLTQYSHGAGCGCKISPKVLETILHSEQAKFVDRICLWVMKPATMRRCTIWAMAPALSVPPTSLCRSLIILSILAALRRLTPSAISSRWGQTDYGGAILGWPINKLSPEIAREVTEGGRYACRQAGIALAGGHSIDAPEPILVWR